MMEFQGSQWESQFVTTNKRPIGPRMSKDTRLDIDKMYLSHVDEELGYAVIPDEYKNWDLFEDDDCDERTIYQVEGPRYTIAHDIHNKALAETICKVPQMMMELKKHYELLDKISDMWWCSPHLSEEHHANITKILAEYRGISHLL